MSAGSGSGDLIQPVDGEKVRKLHFLYRTSFKFDNPVCNHTFALRCVPSTNQVQQIHIKERYVQPADCVDEVTDGFGNRKYVGRINGCHSSFSYGVEGTALVESMKVQKGPLHAMYKYPSKYTGVTKGLRDFYEQFKPLEGDALSRAVFLMNTLYEKMTYESGSTDIHTTAGEAFHLGKGVCQDYAHILITLCKMAGIPARYVVGMMIGEGYTHAWVEIYTKEGWYGLDPTNNLHIDDYYIKIAHGRDYADCIVDRGIFLGNTSQHQEITVSVEEIS